MSEIIGVNVPSSNNDPLGHPRLDKPLHEFIKQVLRDSLTIKLEVSDTNSSNLIFLVKATLLLDGEEITDSYDTLSIPFHE